MIKSYKTSGVADIARGIDSRQSRKTLPPTLQAAAQRKLAAIHIATSLQDLDIPGYRLEKLSGERKGQYSIRINRQYRICFIWDKGDAFEVQIVDYH